jgi:hypothetical protein
MLLELLFCLTTVDAVEDSLRLGRVSAAARQVKAPKHAQRSALGWGRKATVRTAVFGCSVKVWTKG